MYLSYLQIATSATVKSVPPVSIPAKATHAEIQADTQAVRYTMDGVTAPASGSGMLFQATEAPRMYAIEDVKKLNFVQGAGGAGNLNFHFFCHRNV